MLRLRKEIPKNILEFLYSFTKHVGQFNSCVLTVIDSVAVNIIARTFLFFPTFRAWYVRGIIATLACRRHQRGVAIHVHAIKMYT